MCPGFNHVDTPVVACIMPAPLALLSFSMPVTLDTPSLSLAMMVDI